MIATKTKKEEFFSNCAGLLHGDVTCGALDASYLLTKWYRCSSTYVCTCTVCRHLIYASGDGVGIDWATCSASADTQSHSSQHGTVPETIAYLLTSLLNIDVVDVVNSCCCCFCRTCLAIRVRHVDGTGVVQWSQRLEHSE